MHARLAVARAELPRAVRIAIAAALAWWVARLLGADRPVFAVIVPMVAIRDDTHERIWETGVDSVVTLVVAAFVLPPDPLLAHSEEHARAGARAVEDLPRSLRALRLSPLRRGSRPRLELVAQRQRLALRLAIQVRRLARDLAGFAHRDDLQDRWREAARRLPPIIGLVAAASTKALAGEGSSQEVASARELVADFQREDARPVSAILQRPLVLLLDELAGRPA